MTYITKMGSIRRKQFVRGPWLHFSPRLVPISINCIFLTAFQPFSFSPDHFIPWPESSRPLDFLPNPGGSAQSIRRARVVRVPTRGNLGPAGRPEGHTQASRGSHEQRDLPLQSAAGAIAVPGSGLPSPRSGIRYVLQTRLVPYGATTDQLEKAIL